MPMPDLPTQDMPSAFAWTHPRTLTAMMQARDWAATSVGLPDRWPVSLKTAVDLVLGAGYPMCLGWGEELTFFYNQAYAAFLGSRHPAALG